MNSQLPIKQCIERGLLTAVFGGFAAFWVITYALSEPPEFRQMYFITAAFVGVVAALWATSLLMLLRAWWTRTFGDQAAHDGPALLVAVSAAALPADRGDWGEAMTAELAQVDDREARWRFAAGCARTALFPPRGGAPVMLVAA